MTPNLRVKGANNGTTDVEEGSAPRGCAAARNASKSMWKLVTYNRITDGLDRDLCSQAVRGSLQANKDI